VATHGQFRFDPWPGRASGYIVDTMQTVLHHFFTSEGFEDCLVGIVNRGGDADTNGALAGMLAGALHGVDAIPRFWLNRLERTVTDEIEMQTDALLKLALLSAHP
jgi:ADP-ribosyl-[dinitrogen reductase] hydrolase